MAAAAVDGALVMLLDVAPAGAAVDEALVMLMVGTAAVDAALLKLVPAGFDG